MHPQEFLELTETQLLMELGDKLHDFFGDNHTIYTPWDEAQANAGELKQLYQCEKGEYIPVPPMLQKLLLFKRGSPNPRSSIKPIAQLNMVANATFHLMAQQIALMLHTMPELNQSKVLETTFENIRTLVTKYREQAEKETQDGKANDQGDSAVPAGATSPN